MAEVLTTVRLSGTDLAAVEPRRAAMSLVRPLGFRTLTCGCVIGRYREVATSRELTYVEEKGQRCDSLGHRRNHTITVGQATATVAPLAVKAS